MKVRTWGDPCHDCGSYHGETRFPRGRRPIGQPRLCCDCLVERARVARRDAVAGSLTLNPRTITARHWLTGRAAP
jgi:hypothetical protein